jgi:two-component sensor histidine kinase
VAVVRRWNQKRCIQVAKTGSFIDGMDKATVSAKNTAKNIGASFSSLGAVMEQALAPFGQIGAQISSAFEGIGQSVSKSAGEMRAASGIGAVALAGLGAAAVAAAGALVELSISGGEMVESLALMSQKTGIGVRDLQTLQAAGNTVGLPLEAISTAMRKFSEALTGTGKGGSQLDGVLKNLGITSHDSNEALLQVADAFQRMQDGPVKASLAVELFGRSGLDLIPLLDKGRAGLQEFSDIVDQFGPNVDQNAVAAMDRWKVSTEKLSLAWDSFKVSLSGGVGILAHLVDGIANATKGFSDMAAALIKNPLASLGALANGGLGGLLVSAEVSKTPSNPSDVAQKRAEIAAQDSLIAKQKELFAIQQAGGAAEYALAQKKLAIEGAVEAGDYAHALTLQKEIPALQDAADKEKARAAAAKATVAAHERLLELIQRQGAGKIHVSNINRQEPKVAAPDIQTTAQQFSDVGESLQKLTNGVTDDVRNMGKDAIADFYKEWDRQNKDTIDEINQRFTDQLNNFKGLLALQAISQQQFNDVSKALETQRVAEIQKIQQKQGTDFATSFASVFAEIADQADKFAKNLADSIGGAVNDLSGQLASLATTGRSNFKQVGQSLEANVIKSGTSALIGSATKHIAGAFGVSFGKPDGTSNNPIYTRSADGIADHVKSLGHKLNLGHIGSDISGVFKGGLSGLGSIFGSLFSGGGFGSIFGSLGGLFGGFRADGGSVSPGVSYIVGEKGRERFVPATAGTIIPNSSSSGNSNQRPIQVSAHFHGVTDADTFKASKTTILNNLANAVGRAAGRR